MLFRSQALVPELLKSADPKEVARGKLIYSRGAILTAALGGPLAEHRDLARTMSPVNYVTRDDAPFLLVHGDRDFLVPLAQSELLAAALKKVGVDATLEIVPGAGHGFGRPKPELMAKIKAFFDAKL